MTADILARCRAAGFAVAGVAPATPSPHAAEVRAWIAEGGHGEMTYLADRVETMLDPGRLLPGARSILCVADRYHDGRRDRPADPAASPRGRVARYARGSDYHRAMKKRLHAIADALREVHAGHDFRSCVDTAPILEREHAAAAGIGAIGKHGLVIERGVGSWMLLGEIVTTMDLAPSAPAEPDPCGACTRCIDACPTDAIRPWRLDATRCIAYLTIEHRGPLEPALAERLEGWIFGCDVCQEVCPHARATRRSRRAAVHEAYAPRAASFDLLEVLGWDDAARRDAFTGTAMRRASLAMMKRNAIWALLPALRAGRAGVAERLAALAADDGEPDLVRDAARAVLARAGR